MIVTVRLSDELIGKVDALGKRSEVIRQALESWTEHAGAKTATKPKPAKPAASGDVGPCPRCEKPMIRWSAQLNRCVACVTNWPANNGR